MSAGEWFEGGPCPCKYKANLVTHAPFIINGTITLENHRVNHGFREGVVDLLHTKNQDDSTDFITVADAQQQILLQTGLTVSHSTAARWIAEDNLGYKRPGVKRPWIVYGVLFDSFLLESKAKEA